MARNYTNTAPPIGLTVAATTTSTTLTVASTTGYPEPPFTIGLERGTANEEVVLCTAKTATTFTVTRGFDGTTGRTHAIGTSVEHTVAAIDYRQMGEHIDATAAHGVTTVVGVSEAQTLVNKTISGASNNLINLVADNLVGTVNPNLIPYFPWGKLTGIPGQFPPISHTHDASQITGTINAARINGRQIFVQSATPTGVNGDIWFQV